MVRNRLLIFISAEDPSKNDICLLLARAHWDGSKDTHLEIIGNLLGNHGELIEVE